jgi:DNA topoisomerase-3
MKAIESSTIAVLAEKPSVARDIARVLGADKRGEGYLQKRLCRHLGDWTFGFLGATARDQS